MKIKLLTTVVSIYGALFGVAGCSSSSKVCDEFFAENNKCMSKLGAGKAIAEAQEQSFKELLKNSDTRAATESACKTATDMLKMNPMCK